MHDAHISVGTLDTVDRRRAVERRTSDLVGAVAVATIDVAVAARARRNALEVAALELGLGVARRVDTIELVAVVAALIDTVASLGHGQTPSVAASKLGRLASMIRAVVHRLVAIVCTVSLSIACESFTLYSRSFHIYRTV